MFFNSNQVTLLGYISKERIKKFYTPLNQLCVIFELRTEYKWLSREGAEKMHYDFHNAIVRDVGKRDIATRTMSLIVPGNKVLIQGRLRSHLGADSSSWWARVCEVDVTSIEVIKSDNIEEEHEIINKSCNDAISDSSQIKGHDKSAGGLVAIAVSDMENISVRGCL